ncbi:MAG: anti-sigma regulatory factor [Firmicutes bacterium]|jgi:anti-sigma regulatory factor (Ser/Thr protein kinase)|nr:anti-sigma regulatory factor [Bacillota bacterium]
MEFSIARYDFTAAGEAATKIKRVLRQLGLDAETVRRVAVAAYEAEMNLVIHSTQGGRLALSVDSDKVTLTAEDTGPGIPDIDLAMREGYSTAPDEVREMGFGAGMGLPNMKRCADQFRIESAVGSGTTVEIVVKVPKVGAADA